MIWFRIKSKKPNKVKEIKVIEFDHRDVVRHPLVTKIIQAFNKNIDDKINVVVKDKSWLKFLKIRIYKKKIKKLE